MQTTKYVRKTFYVDAVQVTAENMPDAAQWCDGEINFDEEGNPATSFIKVRVKRPVNAKQTQAYIGDWILKSDAGFKVYTSRAFANSFVPAESDSEDRVVGNVFDTSKTEEKSE